MNKDSLIDKIAEAMCEKLPKKYSLGYSWYTIQGSGDGAMLRDMAKAAIAAMRDASTRKDEVCQGCDGRGIVGNILDTDFCPFCRSEKTSEICDAEMLLSLMKAGYQKHMQNWDTCRDDSLKESLEAIRPYLATREPVSVSLAKCKWELSKVFVPDGVWNIEEGMKMERAAKAVLDAAGVKYVD